MGVVLRRRLEDLDVRARDLSVAVGHTRERIAYGHEVLAQLVQARTYKARPGREVQRNGRRFSCRHA